MRGRRTDIAFEPCNCLESTRFTLESFGHEGAEARRLPHCSESQVINPSKPRKVAEWKDPELWILKSSPSSII